MHIRIYLENPEAMGVCHAHPPISTSFAIAGIGLDKAIYPEALVNLGTVPCVHYEAPGSQGIPDSIAPYAKDYNALLLANPRRGSVGPDTDGCVVPAGIDRALRHGHHVHGQYYW